MGGHGVLYMSTQPKQDLNINHNFGDDWFPLVSKGWRGEKNSFFFFTFKSTPPPIPLLISHSLSIWLWVVLEDFERQTVLALVFTEFFYAQKREKGGRGNSPLVSLLWTQVLFFVLDGCTIRGVWVVESKLKKSNTPRILSSSATIRLAAQYPAQLEFS